MHVIEIFLPLKQNDGSPQPARLFGELRSTLVERFGGLTAYSRTPAEGLWEDDDGAVTHDSIVIFEVIAETLDRGWWAERRRLLEQKFGQDELLIRASAIERL